LSDPYGKNVNTELRTVNGSELKFNPIAAIDLGRHVVEERRSNDFESCETFHQTMHGTVTKTPD
jgi:hypothetical protein